MALMSRGRQRATVILLLVSVLVSGVKFPPTKTLIIGDSISLCGKGTLSWRFPVWQTLRHEKPESDSANAELENAPKNYSKCVNFIGTIRPANAWEKTRGNKFACKKIYMEEFDQSNPDVQSFDPSAVVGWMGRDSRSALAQIQNHAKRSLGDPSHADIVMFFMGTNDLLIKRRNALSFMKDLQSIMKMFLSATNDSNSPGDGSEGAVRRPKFLMAPIVPMENCVEVNRIAASGTDPHNRHDLWTKEFIGELYSRLRVINGALRAFQGKFPTDDISVYLANEKKMAEILADNYRSGDTSDIVAEKQKVGEGESYYPFTLMDYYPGYNSTYHTDDCVHPNPRGTVHMARVFSKHLMKALEERNPRCLGLDRSETSGISPAPSEQPAELSTTRSSEPKTGTLPTASNSPPRQGIDQPSEATQSGSGDGKDVVAPSITYTVDGTTIFGLTIAVWLIWKFASKVRIEVKW